MAFWTKIRYNGRDMNIYNEVLQRVVAGNTVHTWVLAGCIFVLTVVALALFKLVLLKKLRKLAGTTSIRIDDIAVEVLQSIGVPFYFIVALYVSVQQLTLPSIVTLIIQAAFLILVVNEVIKFFEKGLSYAATMRVGSGGEQKKMSSALSVVIRIVLWCIGAILVLSNLGFNVTSLVTSLGIGGIAISLALQNILGDIFSSFSIAFDKPFEEGDFIVVGEYKGTVRHIGIKTTRLEALQGEEIVISNAELTSARVQNFKKMEHRRAIFTIGVTYDTPVEKLKQIPSMIQGIIDQQEHARFDRAHFFEFADSSLNFEVVYYVETREYLVYMNIQQDINLKLHEEFGKQGIEMAFPTRTVHLVKD